MDKLCLCNKDAQRREEKQRKTREAFANSRKKEKKTERKKNKKKTRGFNAPNTHADWWVSLQRFDEREVQKNRT
jgi:hypothetical protein